MNTLIIRLAQEADIEAIYQVHQSSVRRLCACHYSAEQIAMWLEGRQPDMYLPAIRLQQLWVADNGSVVGFIENDGAEISKLFVAGDQAATGIGQRLLNTALAAIWRQGVDRVYLESTLTAVPFYQKNGFHLIGHGIFTRGSSKQQLEIVKMERMLDCGLMP